MELSKKKCWLNLLLLSMVIAFVVLIAIQIVYYIRTAKMFEEQFELYVHRAITQTAYAIEEKEIVEIVHEIAQSNTPEAERAKQIINANNAYSLQEIYLFSEKYEKEVKGNDISTVSQDEKERLKKNLAANRDLMYAVFARKYSRHSSEHIGKRVGYDFIRTTLKKFLHENRIYMDFSFAVRCNRTGKLMNVGEKAFDLNDERCYSGRTYSHDESGDSYDMIVFFPKKKSYLTTYMGVMFPFLLASSILIILCISTIVYLVRQRHFSEIQNDFVRNMTHELKTPVASISLAAQMLSDPSVVKSEEMSTRMCETIKNESKRLVLLIDSVLETSVLEHRDGIANPSPLDVHDIIQSARNSLLVKAENHKGEIRLSLEADEFIVMGDETHLTNVIFNLMDNAIKYASPHRNLILEVRTYNQGDQLLIDILDNGIGIDKQYLPYIFNKYYRVPTGDLHDIKGFGLGLAYVSNMVKRHHGHIRVKSETGIGTLFTIDLPIYSE